MYIFPPQAESAQAALDTLDGAFVDFELTQSRSEFDSSLIYLELTARAMGETGLVLDLGKLSGWCLIRPIHGSLSKDDQYEIEDLMHAANPDTGLLAEDLFLHGKDLLRTARADRLLILEKLWVRDGFEGQDIEQAMLREMENFLSGQAYVVLTSFSVAPQKAEIHSTFAALQDGWLEDAHVSLWPGHPPQAREILHINTAGVDFTSALDEVSSGLRLVFSQAQPSAQRTAQDPRDFRIVG